VAVGAALRDIGSNAISLAKGAKGCENSGFAVLTAVDEVIE
jgi:hypothetical protein